jgi:formate hydrogenlyase subunit 3/multisubunit Na+/H+ antiporter MnhD subunit
MAGGLIPGLGGSPAGLDVVVRPSILLGLGFAFLLAVFPFYAWVPRLAESNRPFRVGFVLLFMNLSVSVMGILLVDRFVWLRDSERGYAVLRFIGLLVSVTGGFMSAFQKNWSRQMGFAMLVENGLVLTALGSGLEVGLQVISALLLVRVLGFLVWCSGLGVVKDLFGSLDFEHLHGAARVTPFIAGAALVGQFSIAGFPLLAGFVPRLSLMMIFGPDPESFGVWVAILGVGIGGLRALSVLFLRPSKKEKAENQAQIDPLSLRFQAGFLVIGSIVLFLFGIFPQWYAEFVARFPLIFSQFTR